jgi:eukaryotic-like serine/threonine-protein kinase
LAKSARVFDDVFGDECEMTSQDNNASNLESTDRFVKLSKLMDEALALPSNQWETFCSSLETSDAEQASMLRELLRAHADAEAKGFLERTISPEAILEGGESTAASDIQPKRTGLMLGPYRLIRKLGEGGMSSVWLAERDHGNFKRQVALKCLSAYFGNAEFRDRLLKEAMILGRLSHPGIAQLLDAGLSSDGEPYMALELIDGEPITEHCDRLKLDLKARVRLAAEACEAVAFLHSHAIVHRDIKPSNVFVDKSGRVKLLDFGIAKILDEVPGEVTHASSMAFTPEYAAPEQMTGGQITTATDVYAIGVLLYRLLTGTRPYARGAAPMVVASAVLNTLPSRPSTLFWPTGGMPAEEAQRAADVRNTSVKQIRLGLRDDLDNILLKCLEKESARRYGTVEALRGDLLAHLHSRPVQARPQSAFYILRKFASRHRGSVATGTVALAGLIAAVGFGVWQARQTQLEAENTKRVLAFLQTLIAEANPSNTGVETITVLDLLKRAPDVAKKQFAESAELQYQVLRPVERILIDLGANSPLEAVQREMVKLLDGLDTLSVEDEAEQRSSYGKTLAELGRSDEADRMLRHAIDQLTVANKRDSPIYAEALMRKAVALVLRGEKVAGAKLATESFRMTAAREGPDGPNRTHSAYAAIAILVGAGHTNEAVAIAEKELTPERVAREPNRGKQLEYRIARAQLMQHASDPYAAAKEHDSLLEDVRIHYGERYDIYATLLSLAARSSIDVADYGKAVRLLEEAATIERRDVEAYGFALVSTLSQLAITHLHRGALSEARAALAESTELVRAGKPARSMYWAAGYYLALAERDYERAAASLDRWDALLPASTPENDANKVRIRLHRASVLRVKGDFSRSLAIYEEAIPVSRTHNQPDHYRVASIELQYAQTLMQAGQGIKASQVAEQANARIVKALGDSHPLTLQGQYILGTIEQKLGNPNGVERASRAAKRYEERMGRPLEEPLVRLH